MSENEWTWKWSENESEDEWKWKWSENESENEKFDLQIGNLSKFITRKKIVEYYVYKIPKLDEKSRVSSWKKNS